MEKTLSIAGVTLGFFAAFWPLGYWYTRRLTDGGDEPLGLLVLGVLTILIFIERKNLTHTTSKLTLAAAGACFTLYILSTFWLPPMLRCVPAILCITFYFGWHKRPGWLALMFLSLPLVASLQFYLGYPLRLVSTETTRWLVYPFVNDIIREGTTLTAHGKIVGVDPPCSGIKILWVGLVFTNIVTSLVSMKWRKAITFNLLAIGLLLSANSVRAALLFAPESGAIDIPDALHEGIGIICYLGVVLFLVKIASLNSYTIRTHTIS